MIFHAIEAVQKLCHTREGGFNTVQHLIDITYERPLLYERFILQHWSKNFHEFFVTFLSNEHAVTSEEGQGSANNCYFV